jgi:hypothetical protein
MEKQDLISGSALIIKDFQLESDALIDASKLTYDALINRLVEIVDHLIAKDFNRLLNALYRIDVSEEKLKSVLAKRPENTSLIIAQMVLERELQKVASRKKHVS